MPEPLRVSVYCEGPDDRAVLRTLQKGGVLPARLHMAEPSGGESKLAHDVAPFVSPEGVSGRAIVLRDFDDLDAGAVGAWFEKGLRANLSPAVTLTANRADEARVTVYEATKGAHRGLAAIVPVGRPRALDLRATYGVETFAVDDYLLVLAREVDVYDALVKGEKDVEVGHALAHRKLGEVLDLMKANGIPATKSKRLMHLFRAITGFRASPATFAERVVSKAIEVRRAAAVAELMQPLVGDIEQALAAIG
jgi:hypothetical protein